MRTTKSTDPFELGHCLAGIGLFINYSYNQILDFCYYLTFKKSLKALGKEFNDAYKKPIEETSCLVI